MTVYKYFLRLAYRNKGVVLIYLVLYTLMTILNGTGLSKDIGEYSDIAMNIGYMDYSGTDLSKGLLDSLKNKNYLEKVDYDYNEIKEQLYLQIYDAIIVIPEDFKDRVLNGEDKVIEVFKDSQNIYSHHLDSNISKYLSYINAMNLDGNYDLDKLYKVMEKEARVINIASGKLNSRAMNFFNSYFMTFSYIIMGLFISVLGKLILEFNDKNIASRTYISSKSNIAYNKEIYLAEFTLAFVFVLVSILAVFIYKSEFISGMPIKKYIANAFAFSFATLGLTFLVGNLARNIWAVNAIGTLLSLGLSFISGAFVPQDMLSEGTLKLAKFFPNYYYLNAISDSSRLGVLDTRKEIFIQILFGIVYFLLGVYFSRNKRIEIE